MVTDKPPRRAKSKKEPLTIDATAADTETVAQPIRSNDSDDPPISPEERAVEIEDEPVSSAADTSPPAEPETTSNEALLAADSEASSAKEIPSSEPVPEEAAIDSRTTDAEKSPPPPPPPATPSATRGGASASTLIAAGIFGGLVALALAGSMQYAGFLPNGSAGSGTAEEIAALRQQVQALGQRPAPDPELQGRLETLEAAVAESAESGAGDRLSALEQELAAVREAAESASGDSAGRLDQLQQRLEAVETALNEPGAEEVAARAVAAAALKAAADRGGPFAAELQTFAAVAPEDPAVAPLQALSDDGVPTRSQLADRFPPVAEKIVEATRPAEQDQGIAGRLISSAMSVVKVRRTGEVEGDTPDAVVSRIENALRSGDLQAAASQWETLPEGGKAASQEFKQALDARIAVDALTGDSVARAVNATANQN